MHRGGKRWGRSQNFVRGMVRSRVRDIVPFERPGGLVGVGAAMGNLLSALCNVPFLAFGVKYITSSLPHLYPCLCVQWRMACRLSGIVCLEHLILHLHGQAQCPTINPYLRRICAWVGDWCMGNSRCMEKISRYAHHHAQSYKGDIARPPEQFVRHV